MNQGKGYINHSMSVNAQIAYDQGEKPLSKWNKRDIIKAILEEPGNIHTKESLEKLNLATLKENFLEWSAWHHTSKHYNQTDFYKINAEQVKNPQITISSKSKGNSEQVVEKATITYKEWKGTRRNGIFITVTTQALVKGNWAYTLSGKKSLNGKHIEKVEKHGRAPSGTAETYKDIAKKYRL